MLQAWMCCHSSSSSSSSLPRNSRAAALAAFSRAASLPAMTLGVCSMLPLMILPTLAAAPPTYVNKA